MTGVFGSRNQRLIKRYGSLVAAANAFEASLTTLSDERSRAKTLELKERYAAHKDLDALLPEAFALVREAAHRTLEMRHFDVQLIGGIALHQGKIAEMRTGEGKTLIATLAVYLNALTGNGVHLVTVNEYLAQRDADWMGPVYRFLGLDGRASSRATSRPTRSGRRTRPTSPTARTTSSASTICATTSRSGPRTACSARSLRDRRRGRLDPDRRGAHAADHLRPLRGEHRALRAHQPPDPVAEGPQPAARQGQRRDRVDAGRAARASTASRSARCRRARRSTKAKERGLHLIEIDAAS